MTAPVFVDTNVFIYAVDLADPKKQKSAQSWLAELWTSRNGRVSFQVLQEFYAKVSQKGAVARDEARAEVRGLLAWNPIPVNAEILDRGWRIQDRYQLSFWDSLIVAAARSASCRYLLTEDLQDGQSLEGLLVVSPFTHDPASLT
ncbi:MAG TPA: PIN domain-containing protein [Candidatus Acidoferrum sp.]|nr:PIN domain-containing protein [Candidatus Acidoferrum sp.]